MMNGAMVSWMWVWPTFVLAGLLTIGYVAVRLVQDGRLDQHGRGTGEATGTTTSSARRVLDERFARGEIDEAEYQHRRGILT